MEFLEKRKTKPLNRFEIQKLCVSLKAVLTWLPISTKPYKFGYTATIGYEQVVDRLTRGPTAPCKYAFIEGRHVVLPNQTYISLVNPVWEDGEIEREFHAYGTWDK